MTRTSLGRLLLGCATVAALLTGCGEEDSPGGSPGAAGVVEGSDATTVEGTEFPVTVPSGRWTFTVSAPTDDLPDDVADEAPEGGTWIGLAWAPAGDAPEFGPVLLGTEPEVATVTTAGAGDDGDVSGEVTLLGPPDQGGTANGVVWIPVASDTTNDTSAIAPTLVVAYDGLEQRFDLTDGSREAGPADGFYDEEPPLEGVCPAQGPATDPAGFEADVACDVLAVASVPYVAGEGWVGDAGSTWYVVDLRLGPGDFRYRTAGAEAGYDVEDVTTTVALGEEPATVTSADETAAGGWTATVVAAGSATTPPPLDVRRTYSLRRADGPSGAPADQRLDVAFSVALLPTS